MSYDLDLRKRAIVLIEEVVSVANVSRVLGVSEYAIRDWKKRHAQGCLAAQYPKRRGAYHIQEEALKAHLQEKPDAYLSELAEVAGGTSQGVSHALRRLGITRKKRHQNTENEMRRKEKHI
ncbi:MAG: IS630 transposase-related protein [Deinococcales bacterium]